MVIVHNPPFRLQWEGFWTIYSLFGFFGIFLLFIRSIRLHVFHDYLLKAFERKSMIVFYSLSIYEGNRREANNIRYILYVALLCSVGSYIKIGRHCYSTYLNIYAMVSIAINCKMFNWIDLLLVLVIDFSTQHKTLTQCKSNPFSKQNILNYKFVPVENIQIDSAPFSI